MNTTKGDFVEIKYVGRLDDGSIFDLNDAEVAKQEKIKAHIHDHTIICLGSKDVVQGLDDYLIGKEIGKKLTTSVSTEQGFGKRNAKLFKTFSLSKFKGQEFKPLPGIAIEVDGAQAVIKSVSGGRVLLDFNHPLAGKQLHYEVTITRKIDSLKEKVSGILETNLHIHQPKVEEKDGTVTLEAQIPKEMQPVFETELKKRIPELKAFVIENLRK